MMQGMIATRSAFFYLSPQDITIVAVVPYHLFLTVWHMTAQCSQSLQRIKGLGLPGVFSLIHNFALVAQVEKIIDSKFNTTIIES